MRKLMTMLAATAMAFGLYADGPLNDVWDASTLTKDNWNASSQWTVPAGAAADAAVFTGNEAAVGNKLTLKTGGAIVSRDIYGKPFGITSNVYFDVNLDFLGQALDELPTADQLTGAKLALFVLDSSEIEGAPKATNFYAIAENPTLDGKWLYELGVDLEDVNAGARFTIKAYKNVLATGTRAGFKLFLNGDETEGTADLVEVVGAYPIEDGAVIWSQHKSSTDLENAYLRDFVAQTLKKNHRAVLLSLQETAGAVTVSSMDFAGNAEISTVNFNDSGYNFIASDADVMTIASETTGLTIADVKVGGESVLSDGVITAEAGDTLVVTLNGTFDIVEWYANGVLQYEVTGNTFATVFEANVGITVSGSAAGAEIDGKKFKTLRAALDSDEQGEIKLLTTADLGADQTIAVSSDATIDLNGQTITGAGDSLAGYAVIELNGGVLTIKDSSVAQTGRILPVAGSGANAVYITDGKLVVAGGIFDGEIVGATAITAAITGGKFASDNGSTFYLAACMDRTAYKDTYAEGYWTVAAKGPTVAKIDDAEYESITEALAAAQDGDTIALQMSTTEKGIQIAENKFPTTGLTIDLAGFVWTIDDAVASDPIDIRTNNIVTIKSGTIVTSKAFRDIVRVYGHAPDTVVTFNDVVFNGANILATVSDKATDIIRIEGGEVNLTGSTSINAAGTSSATYAIKFGNHANGTQYSCGTLTVNTTGDIKGKVILMGGAFQEVAVGSGSDIEYHFANNAFSTYVDGMATDGNGNQLFAARIGVLPAVTGTTTDETNDVGVLYKDLAAAKDAAAQDDTLTLIKPITLAANTAFDCVVAVASNDFVDARIALETFSFTENGGALTSDDFTTEVDKKDNRDGTFTYTVKSAEQPAKPEDPIVVPEGAAEAKADELNQKGNDAKDLPDAVKELALTGDQVTAYKNLFTFVATSDSEVQLLLTDPAETVSNNVATATKAIEVANIAAGTAKTIEFTTGIPGLYYQLNADDTLEGIKQVDEMLCGADGKVTFDEGVKPTAGDTARFFKISASASPKITNQDSE